MQMNKGLIFIWFFLSALMVSCIDRYFIENEVDFQPTLVIEGTITDEQELQKIVISRSSSLESMEFQYVDNALVTVISDNGTDFHFNFDYESKVYIGLIPLHYLIPGNAFKLRVQYENKIYESTFETMSKTPVVDSVYHELQINQFFENESNPRTGLQFYLDLRVDKEYSSYYRWKLEETYEYHATWPIGEYWAGGWVDVGQDYSYFVCYKTEPIQNIFSVTTDYVDDVYLKYPLHFVDNSTQKLYYRYSLLVKQYSLSADAYIFWQRLMEISQNSGGLFDKQPANIQGNITCLSDVDEKVLGYFSVSQVSSKRIFVDNTPEMTFTDDLFCVPELLEMPIVIYNSKPEDWPFYIAPVPNGGEPGIYIAPNYCFDCRKAGGTIEKPDFWDQN
ncbi:MAG: DUF4249 domain-containing protein [Salinivirgaceae bacterium]